ncbi:MAG: hypothetical protein Ct9H300mP14_02080 [Gammaproteobacteria bacterium]|nr:MAG: hypothetical protein Ct9H300mP14_02080 [Gammaproteobacteria bacterium]
MRWRHRTRTAEGLCRSGLRFGVLSSVRWGVESLTFCRFPFWAYRYILETVSGLNVLVRRRSQ